MRAPSPVGLVTVALTLWLITASSSSAAPACADSSTVILDHFEGTTDGLPVAVSYGQGMAGYGQAVFFEGPSFVQYPLPTSVVWNQLEGSVEMWVKPVEESYGTGLDFNWYNTSSYPAAGHVLGFYANDPAIGFRYGNWNFSNNEWLDSGVKAGLGEWTHLAATWGPAGTHLYHNGLHVASTATNLYPANGAYAYLNFWGNRGSHYVDELHISRVQRTQAEIAAHAWRDDLPTGTGSYSDGFECDVLSPFWYSLENSGFITPRSTEQMHSGASALKFTSTMTPQNKWIGVLHDFAKPVYGTFSVWVYDTMAGDSDSNYITLLVGNTELQVSTGIETQNWEGSVYWIFRRYNEPHTATSVPRTQAWHHWMIECTAEELSLEIDGIRVYSGTDSFPVDHILMNLSTSFNKPAEYVYLDDFQMHVVSADIDGDGVLNSDDNCPDVANPDQTNVDNDLLGDACDACPIDPENDEDGDGVCGDIDACPHTIQGVTVDAEGCPPLVPGDFDRDGDVDQEDFAVFQRCQSGPNIPADPNCAD